MSLFSSVVSGLGSIASSVSGDNPFVNGAASVVKDLADQSSDSSTSTSSTDTSTASTASTSTGTGSISFDDLFQSLLPTSQTSVSEEQLFSAVVEERIAQSKGTDAANQYVGFLKTEEANFTGADGHIEYEHAAKAALKDMRAAGDLTSDETDQIYTQSFNAAQLDTNTDALWDDVGGGNDPTKAVASRDDAMEAAQKALTAIDAGTVTLTPRSVDEAEWSKPAVATQLSAPISTGSGSVAASSGGSGTGSGSGSGGGTITSISGSSGGVQSGTYLGGTIAGAAGFLFNPAAAGGLAITLPSDLGDVTSVDLIDSSNNKLVEREKTPKTEKGLPAYQFKHGGGDYPINLNVQVNLADGTKKTYFVPDPTLSWAGTN